MPEQKKFDISKLHIREIDINPPIIFGKTDEGIRRLIPGSIITDSSKHNDSQIAHGIYSKSSKRVITLDSLDTEIKLYKLNNTYDRNIVPQSQKENDVIVIGFAHSEKEQRIGATLKDVSLIFWDKADSYKFQKCFSIASLVPDYQTNIWHLENSNSWITTDKTNGINFWDLEHESLKKHLESKEIAGTIVEIVDITHVQLVGVASLDKKITVWDFEKETLYFTIDLSSGGGVHNLVYSYAFQSIVTAGFENDLRVFRIDPQHLDYDAIGVLSGHSSMITAVELIDKSPMVISADDNGTIKVWDIRSLKCLQTFNIGVGTCLTQIIDVSDKNMICLLGSRVNFISFDTQVQNVRQSEEAYPIKVEYNAMKQEMVICTRKDVRFLRIKDGKISKIFSGLLQDNKDEISTFASTNQFNNFILGDLKGSLRLYQYRNGEHLKELVSHSSEISQIKTDYQNKLVTTSSLDSCIMIQQETALGGETKRIIQNVHFKKEINLMEVSLFHNIIITGSFERKLYVWDYEFSKLIACIKLERGTEPTAICILSGFCLILIATNAGMIHLIKFDVKGLKSSFELVFSFRINDEDNKNLSELESKQVNSENYIVSQIQQNNLNRNSKPVNMVPKINPGMHNKTISQTGSFPKPTKDNKKPGVKNQPSKANTSQYQIKFGSTQDKLSKQQLISENTQNNISVMSKPSVVGTQIQLLSTLKLPNQSSSELPNSQQAGNNLMQNSPFPANKDSSPESSFDDEQLSSEWITRILSEVDGDESTGILKKLRIYTSTNKGKVMIFEVEDFLKKEEQTIKTAESAGKRLNYNPLRQAKEDFLVQVQQIAHESLDIPAILCAKKEKLATKQQIALLKAFQAHKEGLTSFQFAQIGKKVLFTSSPDQYIRIWSKSGELLGNVNINHPLPVSWKVQYLRHEQIKKKIFYGLKILDIMFEKNKEDVSLRSLVQCDQFISQFIPSIPGQLALDLAAVNKEKDSQLNQQLASLTLMKDEYSPRDLKYEASKKIYEKELRGTSLQQMESNKRLMRTQQQEEVVVPVQFNELQKKKRKYEEQEIVNFLNENWRDKALNKQGEHEQSRKMYMFGRKLDQRIAEKPDDKIKSRMSVYYQGNSVSTTQKEEKELPLYHRTSTLSTHQPVSPRLLSKQTKEENIKHLSAIPSSKEVLTQYSQISEEAVKKGKKDEVSKKYFMENGTLNKGKEKRVNSQIGKKSQENRAKTMDFLEYATEKNYLDESILQTVTSSKIMQANASAMNISKQTTDNTNSSMMHSNKGNISSTVLHTEPTSIISYNGNNNDQYQLTLPVNLQKAKMSLVLKTINTKLTKSKHQSDLSPFNVGISRSNTSRDHLGLSSQRNAPAGQVLKSNQIYAGEQLPQELLSRGDYNEKHNRAVTQRQSNSILKQQSFLDGLRNSDISRIGFSTERNQPSPLKNENEFRLPLINSQSSATILDSQAFLSKTKHAL